MVEILGVLQEAAIQESGRGEEPLSPTTQETIITMQFERYTIKYTYTTFPRQEELRAVHEKKKVATATAQRQAAGKTTHYRSRELKTKQARVFTLSHLRTRVLTCCRLDSLYAKGFVLHHI